MKLALLTSLVLSIALVSIAHSQPPSPTGGEPSKPKEEETSAEYGKRAADQDDSDDTAIIKDPGTDSSKDGADNRFNEHNGDSSADWWMVRLTITMIAVLLLHLGAYILQWLVLRRTLAHNRESSERQLRAYVNVTEIVKNDALVDPIMFEISLRNNGATPAYDFTGWEVIGVNHFPPPSDIFYAPEREGEVSKAVVGPGSTAHRVAGLTRTAFGELEDAFRNGRAAIYLWGEYNYRDAFGARRLTRFRNFCTYEDLRRGQTADCEEGNDAT